MKRTILVVDDEEKITRVVSLILEHNGYEVLTANNAAEALKKVADNRIDLILADIMMPEVSGYELSQKLKDNPETAKIPLIFLSAKTEVVDKFTGYFVGAAEYITKPFEANQLIERVQRVLEVDDLERVYDMDPLEPKGRLSGVINAGTSTITHPSKISFARIEDVFNICDLALKAIHAKAVELLDEESVKKAFSLALASAAKRHPVLDTFNIVPDGIDLKGKSSVSQADFQEANTGICELLTNFFSNITRSEGKVKQGVRILLLDTSGDSGDFYEIILENAGFTPIHVNSFSEAQDELDGEITPDAILLDTSSPDKKGPSLETSNELLDFYSKMQKDFLHKNIPILIITEQNSTNSADASMSEGSSNLLVKPFTGTELISAIVAMLRK